GGIGCWSVTGVQTCALPISLASVKGLVAVGFAVMAITLGFGATTTVSSGTGFAAAWFAVFGLGLGLAMPQTMNAALSALSAERRSEERRVGKDGRSPRGDNS